MLQPFPPQDNQREARIVADVCDMLHDNSIETQAKVKRWIKHTLNKAIIHKRLWFLDNITNITLGAGHDVVDLVGHFDKVVACYCPEKLNAVTLGQLVEWRNRGALTPAPNAGQPLSYALEAGRRVHLWPCPERAYRFTVLYQRPAAVELVPDYWETILLDGVLGFYGQHFDRDALTQNQAVFENRFWAAVRREGDGSADALNMKRYRDGGRVFGGSRMDADSDTDAATPLTAPASLTGIGFVSINLGDYPLEIV